MRDSGHAPTLPGVPLRRPSLSDPAGSPSRKEVFLLLSTKLASRYCRNNARGNQLLFHWQIITVFLAEKACAAVTCQCRMKHSNDTRSNNNDRHLTFPWRIYFASTQLLSALPGPRNPHIALLILFGTLRSRVTCPL